MMNPSLYVLGPGTGLKRAKLTSVMGNPVYRMRRYLKSELVMG